MAGSLIPKKQKHGFLGTKKEEAAYLGRRAAISGGATVVGTALLGTFLWGPLVTLAGLAGLGYTAHQTWQWFQFRAKWGIRF